MVITIVKTYLNAIFIGQECIFIGAECNFVYVTKKVMQYGTVESYNQIVRETIIL